MDRNFKVASVFALLALATGCGSSSKEPQVDPATGEELASPDAAQAGTDAVPEESLESAPASEELAAEAAPEALPADPLAQTAPESVPAPEETLPGDQLTQAPSPAADPAPVGSGIADSYSVQSGDTLMKIAFEVYGDLYAWKKIYEMNKDVVTDPNRIPRGTTLKIEKPSSPVSISRSGESYVIREGDTLGKISSSVYGTPSKWRKIWDNNRELIKDPNKIYAGFTLYYERDAGTTTPGQPLGETPSSDPSRVPSSGGGSGGN